MSFQELIWPVGFTNDFTFVTATLQPRATVCDMEEKPCVNPQQQRLCLEITNQLRQSPGAVYFNEPVDERKLGLTDYYKRIRNPMDLGTIYHNLEAGSYHSVTDWERDVNTVWSNAETYNGKDSAYGHLAQHMARKFQRLKKPLEIYSVSGWSKYVYGVRRKMDRLLRTCPVHSIAGKSLDSVLPLLAPFTSREIGNFMRASEMVNKPKDIEQVCEILRRNDPPINTDDNDIVIDVNSLTPQTLHEIRAYYRKQLVEQGLPYPNDAHNDEA